MKLEPGNQLHSTYLVAAVVNAFLMMSVAFYAVLVEVIMAPFAAEKTAMANSLVRYGVIGVGLLIALAIKLVQNAMLQRQPGDTAHVLLAKLSRSAIVTGALCEVPVVLGLVLFLVQGSKIDFYVLAATSLAMWVVYFPRMSQWREFLGTAPHQTAESN